jgi:hypothetical protein
MRMPDSVWIKLNTGRQIRLSQIFQYYTYESLLEGLPDAELNRSIVKHALSRSEELWHRNPYLITPLETPIPPSEGFKQLYGNVLASSV